MLFQLLVQSIYTYILHLNYMPNTTVLYEQVQKYLIIIEQPVHLTSTKSGVQTLSPFF